MYPLLFISASFFLFMFYFVTLLIPHNLWHPSLPQTDISRYLAGLHETGIIMSTKRFTRVFLNAFFINCRPLFYGFALIFTIDIVLVIDMHRNGRLSASHTGIILFQSAAIILFYFLVWKLEPYTMSFFTDVSGMKAHLIKRNIPEPVVSFLFLLGAALALICIFSTIILLPGVTVNNVLSVSEFKELGHFFIAIGVVLVTLYFIFRYIHGITSRDLLTRFSTEQDRVPPPPDGDHRGYRPIPRCRGIMRMQTRAFCLAQAAELLLEAQIYQVEKKTHLRNVSGLYRKSRFFPGIFPRRCPTKRKTPHR